MAKAGRVDRKPEGFDLYPLVVCWDGPRAGSWYFEGHGSTSWSSMVEQAALDSEPGSTITGYVHNDRTMKHPRWPEIRGKVLIWKGGDKGG